MEPDTDFFIETKNVGNTPRDIMLKFQLIISYSDRDIAPDTQNPKTAKQTKKRFLAELSGISKTKKKRLLPTIEGNIVLKFQLSNSYNL